MKICATQTKPIKGDIEANIASHKKLIDLAVSNGAGTIIFPELSITGYEPELAKTLATNLDDSRFDDFQQISNAKHITIGIGMPAKSDAGILISMLIFQPHKQRQIYSKQYLHEDEYPYFVNGGPQILLTEDGHTVAPAICYELSVPEHSANAFKSGATVYIASVAKSVAGVEKALKNLADIARDYSMITLMSNCIGHCDNFDCGGKTSVWNNKGVLLGQLNDTNEGILMIDTETEEVIEKAI